MAVDEFLLNRVRGAFCNIKQVEEKKMFGGICLMVDGKMCVCVRNQYMLCRLNPETCTEEAEKNGVEQMVHGGRVMPGFMYVYPEAMKTESDFNYWINKALAYNKIAKSSKK